MPGIEKAVWLLTATRLSLCIRYSDVDSLRLGIQQGKDLLQDVFLVLQHGKLAHPLAQMQVGKMQKTQTETPPFQSFLYYTAGRGWGQGKLPQSSLRDASPLGDGAFGSAEKLPVLPETPSLRELARHKP